jgi:hypothetical protein
VRLLRARIKGFQSFGDSGDIDFDDGINIIIGQNNGGKSAFLRALLPNLTDDRHRTPDRWESFRLPAPEVTMTIEVSGSEVRDLILLKGGQSYIPIANGTDPRTFAEEFFSLTSIKLALKRTAGVSFSANYPSHQLFLLDANNKVCLIITAVNGEIRLDDTARSESDSLPDLLSFAWQNRMFYFAAERMSIGEAGHGHATRLLPNASNLPIVLHTLSNERGSVFQQLVRHLREIFPTVGNLSVRTKPDQSILEVRVWPTEAMERVELSFPLHSSGTGVSQVIALLTAIMTMDNAVIFIDEINSFLHPAAVKALLRILQTRYAHHQYIISTHAPEVIGFGNPATIHLIKRDGYESSVERLDLGKVSTLREVAEHLGVSMADVFAAERVVWVEGPTEELCFPYLYQQLIGPLPRGTVITSVAATGDFNSNKRDPAIVYEVYRRLCEACSTLVVPVAFSFDTEKLTEDEKAEMRRNSRGLLHFLPRRHLECYLLDPEAIAAFVASKDPISAATVTPQAVIAALEDAASQTPFLIGEWNGDLANEAWLSRVNAAKLIEKVCGMLSNNRAPFGKKGDSLFLLKHILVRDPAQLTPLRDYLASLVPAVT